jgi:hypothetical protein
MSVTISGLIITLLGFIFQHAGIDVGNADLNAFVGVGGQLIGMVIAYIGRIRMGDINPLGIKHPS